MSDLLGALGLKIGVKVAFHTVTIKDCSNGFQSCTN